MTKLVWERKSEGNFICKPDDNYRLEVERLNPDKWWFAVYFKNNEIITKENNIAMGKTKDVKQKCQRVYEHHLEGMV